MTRLTFCGSRTPSCAQAGLVTSVSTRTSIIGAINPRPAVLHASMPWASRPLTDVTGLEGPLLSRFDLVLLLADPRHPDWDRTVAGHVLARSAAAAPIGGSGGEQAAGAAALLPSCSGPALPLALPSTEALSAPPPEPPNVNITTEAHEAAGRGGAHGSGCAEGSQAAGGGSRMTIAEMVAARLGGGGVSGGGGGGGMGAAVAPGTSVSGVMAAAHGRLLPCGSQQQTGQAYAASSGVHPNGEAECDSSSRSSSAWTLDVIRAYIEWAKQRPAPIMSPEVSTCFGKRKPRLWGCSSVQPVCMRPRLGSSMRPCCRRNGSWWPTTAPCGVQRSGAWRGACGLPATATLQRVTSKKEHKKLPTRAPPEQLTSYHCRAPQLRPTCRSTIRALESLIRVSQVGARSGHGSSVGSLCVPGRGMNPVYLLLYEPQLLSQPSLVPPHTW